MHCCAVHFFGEPFIREHSNELSLLRHFLWIWEFFSPWSVNFTDSPDRGLAIFCTVIREFLYFWTVIREFWNLLYEIRDNWLFFEIFREFGDFSNHVSWFDETIQLYKLSGCIIRLAVFLVACFWGLACTECTGKETTCRGCEDLRNKGVDVVVHLDA